MSRVGRIMPAAVEFVDIAGLVKGASEGEGLGNQFLANIRETDAICEVVRYFTDEDIIHVDGRVNPSQENSPQAAEPPPPDLCAALRRTSPRRCARNRR